MSANDMLVVLERMIALACYSWVILTLFEARIPKWANVVAGISALALVVGAWS